MSDESFLLLSLKETKSKKLAQTISNNTSRKILESLAKKEHLSETELAKELKLPLSTIHYNLKALFENKLVTANEYHYSKKGKEILHYKLAKKYIIIAPADTDNSFLEKIKKFLPPTILVVAIAGIMSFAKKFLNQGTNKLSATISNTNFNTIAEEASKRAVSDTAANSVTQVAGNELMQTTSASAEQVIKDKIITQTTHTTAQSEPNIALWFLIGAIVAIVILFLWEWIHRSKK